MKRKNSRKQSVRLPAHVTPIHYAITLRPDLLAHTFTGEETITILLSKRADTITLHSKELKILSASITQVKPGSIMPRFNLGELEAKKISYDEHSETATFLFDRNIPKGKAKLHLTFAGILKDNMRGFYKSRYIVDGKERFMATTQFEATDARRCIPCFDEPTQKAVFEVKLIIPSDKTAISNTLPTNIAEHSSGFSIVSFAPTPKMSTYLLAFIVGDFEWIEKKTKSGVSVRVMTVPGKKHQGKFSLDVTVRCLEFYEDYFKIAYPFNTLDMIAIPDFASLAMENWGAITFREVGLLVDEEHTSTSSRELIAEVIAHELAHQWFGNLVTMEWWTHLWLNEGFASYVPYLALDTLFPAWHVWERFISDPFAAALRLDSLATTHPIEVDVHHPDEIGEIFDDVSYRKGASVIRMLAEYLGKEDFRAGLSYYLKRHSYSNASTVHLWEAFEKVSGKPVRSMMATWTRKPGYPLVRVEEKEKELFLSQGRFFMSPRARQKTRDVTNWFIPLSLVTDRGESALAPLGARRAAVKKPDAFWFKVNGGEKSLVRVAYSESLLKNLKEPILNNRLPAADRLGVIRDLFALSESAIIPTTQALEFSKLYKNETELTVWEEMSAGFRRFYNIVAGTELEDAYKKFVCSIFASMVRELGWEESRTDDNAQKLLRSLLLSNSGFYGDQEIISQAQKLFTARKRKPTRPVRDREGSQRGFISNGIPADLRRSVYNIIAQNGGEAEYKTLLSMYRTENLHEEKNRILGALTQFSDKKLLSRALILALSKDVRLQDRHVILVGVLGNPKGRELAWNFMKKNWKKMGHAYGEGNHIISRLVGALGIFTTREALSDIRVFFKKNPTAGTERTITQVVERIESNALWLARDKKVTGDWLMKQ